MIPPFRGEGLPGTCFISDTSFSAKPPPQPYLPLLLLPPLSFLPQASLFKFPCCQPTLAQRHSLPVSWLNCWRCLLLLGNPPPHPLSYLHPLPLHSFVPSTERGGSDTACVNLTPPSPAPPRPPDSFLLFAAAFSLSPSNQWLSKAGELLIDSHTLTRRTTVVIKS